MRVEIYDGIQKVEPNVWNQIASGYAFAGWDFCAYGEAVLGKPGYYVLVYDGDRAIGGAIFYHLQQDYLPVQNGAIRWLIEQGLKRWPLLVCRTAPPTFHSGLLLPSDPALQAAVLQKLHEASLSIARQQRTSFILLDYLPAEFMDLAWGDFLPMRESLDPDTCLTLPATFEDYLHQRQQVKHDFIKDYRYLTRRLETREGVTYRFTPDCENLEAALHLIRENWEHYHAMPIPFVRQIMECAMGLPDAVWLNVYAHGKLVACELIMTDRQNRVCKPVLYGRDYNLKFAYHYAYYREIEYAIDTLHAAELSGGTGLLPFKQKLGFTEKSQNNLVAAAPARWLHRLISTMG